MVKHNDHMQNTKSHIKEKYNAKTTNTTKYTTTNKKRNQLGRVEKVPKCVTRFIENGLRGRIVTTPPDGHCLRRAIGKICNLRPGQAIQYLHPGQVVQYLAKKCQKILDQELTT